MSSLDVWRPAEVVGEVRRRYTLQTLVDEKGELIVNPLRYFEPVLFNTLNLFKFICLFN